MSERQFQIHLARVYLAQARVWRMRAATMPWYWRSWWVYLGYAAAARRRAVAMVETVQGELFA